MAKETSANLDSLRRSLKRMVEDEDDRPQGGGIEKRRHDRHLYMIEATVRYVKRFEQLSDNLKEFAVITKDLSRSGISFIHQSQMYSGEIVAVNLTVGGARKNLLVRIVRCRRAGLKIFDIAGEFISPDEAEAVDDGQVEAASDQAARPER